MKNIVIIGSGGFAKEVKYLIDAINKVSPQWNLMGFIDDWGKQKGDEIIDGYKIIGNINDLNNTKEQLFAVIAIGKPKYIKEAADKIHNSFVTFANLIHPTVEMNSLQNLGRGNIICFGTFISCDVTIGNFNIFNTKCGVGHDVIIESYNLFNPNAQISGNVHIGNQNLFGMNSSILQKLKVGDNNTIGASSFLTRNAKNNESLFGIPATKWI